MPCPLFWQQHHHTQEIHECAATQFYPFLAFDAAAWYDYGALVPVAPPDLATYQDAIESTTLVTWQEYEGSEVPDAIDAYRHVTSGSLSWAEVYRKTTGVYSTSNAWGDSSAFCGYGLVDVYEAPPELDTIQAVIEFLNAADETIETDTFTFSWNATDSRYDPVIRVGLNSSDMVIGMRVYTLTEGVRFVIMFTGQEPF